MHAKHNYRYVDLHTPRNTHVRGRTELRQGKGEEEEERDGLHEEQRTVKARLQESSVLSCLQGLFATEEERGGCVVCRTRRRVMQTRAVALVRDRETLLSPFFPSRV